MSGAQSLGEALSSGPARSSAQGELVEPRKLGFLSHVRIQTPDDEPEDKQPRSAASPLGRRSSLKGGSQAARLDETRSTLLLITSSDSESLAPQTLRRSTSLLSKVDVEARSGAAAMAGFNKLALRSLLTKEDSRTRRKMSLEEARSNTSPLPELLKKINSLEERAKSAHRWRGSERAGESPLLRRFGDPQAAQSRGLLLNPLSQYYTRPPQAPGLLRFRPHLPSLTYGGDVPPGSSRDMCPSCRLRSIPWYHRLWRSPWTCHYTNRNLCGACLRHRAVIPYRVVQFWDFREYPVSSHAKRFLDAAATQQWIDLRLIHPAIKKVHPSIIDSWHLRHDLMILKHFYITSQKTSARLELNPDCVETFCMHILDYLCPHMPSLGWLSDNTAMFSIFDLQLIEANARRREKVRQSCFASWLPHAACLGEGAIDTGPHSEFLSRLRMVLVFWKDHLSPKDCEDCCQQFAEFCHRRNVTPLLF